jgi:phage gp29-like protein
MAGKKRTPEDQLVKTGLPTYDEISGELINETTSALQDYYRQYIGAYGNLTVAPGDAIFINWDPVIKEQSYLQWAQYDLYWYLEQDPQVRTVLSSAKVNVSGMGWKMKSFLRHGEKKPSVTAQSQSDFVQDMYEGMETFPQHLYDVMDALGKGFSFSENIWALKNGFWTIDHMMNRPQRRIQFDAATRQPRIRTVANPFYGDVVKSGKYIVHRCSTNWENPFGDALDQSIYWMWLFKRTVMKHWMQYLNTVAGPIPIVEHPPKATKAMKQEAMDIARLVREGAFGRIPSNMKLIYAETQKGSLSAESFLNFIREMDHQIDKVVKGQVLTTEGASASGTGSRSMGQTHQITEDQFDIFRAKGLAASINKYMTKFAIDYNYASVEGYPRFAFEVEEEEDLVSASTVLGNLVKALPGYEPDIEQINERFGYTFTKKEVKEPAVRPGINPITGKPVIPQKLDENGEPIIPNQPIEGEPANVTE